MTNVGRTRGFHTTDRVEKPGWWSMLVISRPLRSCPYQRELGSVVSVKWSLSAAPGNGSPASPSLIPSSSWGFPGRIEHNHTPTSIVPSMLVVTAFGCQRRDHMFQRPLEPMAGRREHCQSMRTYVPRETSGIVRAVPRGTRPSCYRRRCVRVQSLLTSKKASTHIVRVPAASRHKAIEKRNGVHVKAAKTPGKRPFHFDIGGLGLAGRPSRNHRR